MKNHSFSDLVDVAEVQRLTDISYQATGMPSSIIALDGSIITGSGWREICNGFHRLNPETRRRCLESDTCIANQIEAGTRYTIYQCKNGLIDAATPLKVHDEHVANFFTGQFLLRMPDSDHFRKQAGQFGFDEVAYMQALSRVPIIDQEKVVPFLEYFSQFAETLGEMGWRQLELIRTRELLQKYELLAERSRDIVLFIRRQDGGIVEANAAAALAYGYTRDELLSLTIYDLRPSESRSEIRYQMHAAGQLGLLFETVHRRKDGSAFPVEVSSTGSIVNDEGMLISVIRDISERKWMEEIFHRTNDQLELKVQQRTSQLQEAYRTLEAEIIEHRQAEAAVHETNRLLKLFAVRSSKTDYLDTIVKLIREWSACECVGVRVLDADKTIPYGSYIGFTKEFWESENCLSLESDDCVCIRVVKGEFSAEDGEYITTCGSFHCGGTSEIPPRLTVEGKERYRGRCIEEGYESVTVVPIIYRGTTRGAIHLADRERSKVPLKTVEFIESIQPIIGEAMLRFDLEEEQQRSGQQLSQAQKMEALGIATGGIAHDFNNILAAIIGFAELVRNRVPKGDKEEHYLNRIVEAGKRGRDLIGQMLTFARKGGQEKKPLQLSRIIADTLRILRASVLSTVDLELRIESDSSIILGDESQIQQIVLNLCTNAAYAMRERGGALEVELTDFTVTSSKAKSLDMQPGSYAKLSVHDTGEGIPVERLNRIFDPFFTTKGPGQGTGLGLSVVHGIVKQHDGYVTVESTPGRGSSFSVFFPKALQGLPEDAVEDYDMPIGQERVLFVDDDEALIEMGQELLRELGYEVTAESSSVKALALFRANPSHFDIVITDQVMPDMTGTELAREILKARKDIPLILCTGFSNGADPQTAKDTGIQAFASKPLTKREIAKTIRRVLDGWQ
jgi:PAS domain S-box-containing protein